MYNASNYCINYPCFSVSELFVDNPTENDRLDVKVNITLPSMRCEREYSTLVHVYGLVYSCK